MVIPPLPKELRSLGRGRPASKYWDIHSYFTEKINKRISAANAHDPDVVIRLTEKLPTEMYPTRFAYHYSAGIPIGYIARRLNVPYFMYMGHLLYFRSSIPQRTPPDYPLEPGSPDWLHWLHIMEGKTTKWIATELGMSPRYLRTILGIHNIPILTPRSYNDLNMYLNINNPNSFRTLYKARELAVVPSNGN